MYNKLINALSNAVSESYLCDNPTLHSSDIEAIVDENTSPDMWFIVNGERSASSLGEIMLTCVHDKDVILLEDSDILAIVKLLVGETWYGGHSDTIERIK